MAYRRRQGISRASTFKEDTIHRSPNDDDTTTSSSAAPSSSLAAQAIRASAAHRDSSISSAYPNSAFHSSFKDGSKGSATYDYTSMGSTNEPGGFWGVLARKAKAILDDDDDVPRHFDSPSSVKPEAVSTSNQVQHQYESFENSRKMDNPTLRKGLDRFTSSLNQIGDTIGNALEEGRTIVDKKTHDIIQETRKLQNRRRGTNDEHNQVSGIQSQSQEPRMQSTQQQTNQENQIKASRDVRWQMCNCIFVVEATQYVSFPMKCIVAFCFGLQVAIATAAKAKLLLRELKTLKADLAFAKQRSSQLEEENKMLREALEKGDNPADDDMIRLQLESLLAEKARLANENSVYARENRFLREIVEYHQLTMQDVVYLDDGIEEVTEVHRGVSRMLSMSPPLPSSPRAPLKRTISEPP
ncbi:hypothetical protein Ccrd_002971 [Cynara cardunculus var. scolymus]|uniref:Uncharacterized protein n=1 Tax=Cynara cardunculus var. scolymus TaxID=59895 RepID=A0A118JX40_CYNCS|nr:hypothetical protein Ccrd_002971 [Cynara cardunculus var. scolymus]